MPSHSGVVIFAIFVVIFVVISAVLVFILAGLRVAREFERAVVFRLGRPHGVAGPGRYWIVPLIESQILVDLRTVSASVRQDAVTRDRVPVTCGAVVCYATLDPVKAVLTVRDIDASVAQAALTALCEIVGRHSLDDLIGERERLSTALREAIDSAMAPCGVAVTRVALSGVGIPESMRRAKLRKAGMPFGPVSSTVSPAAKRVASDLD